MSATVYAGADFRARSLSALTISEAPAAAAPEAAMPEPASRRGAAALPWCDIRVLQDAEREAARHAERLAVLADRVADAGLKRLLAAIAEAHVEDAKTFRAMVAEAFDSAGRPA